MSQQAWGKLTREERSEMMRWYRAWWLYEAVMEVGHQENRYDRMYLRYYGLLR